MVEGEAERQPLAAEGEAVEGEEAAERPAGVQSPREVAVAALRVLTYRIG